MPKNSDTHTACVSRAFHFSESKVHLLLYTHSAKAHPFSHNNRGSSNYPMGKHKGYVAMLQRFPYGLQEDGSPMKGKDAVKMRYMPLLYMVKMTAKYTDKLPHRKNWFTAVQ